MADQVLQTIKDRIDIVDLISSYIQVKRSGTNYKAVCPFHNEQTPSLMISPQKQIWHCFGCGEGGDIFGFLMRYESIEFKEALQTLAAKAGVVLPAYNSNQKSDEEPRKLATRINNFAAKFYHKLITEPIGKSAHEYLIKRGLSVKTIRDWQIGFAPDDFHVLEKELLKKGVTPQDLVKAGVSVQSDRGIYDRFRNRIVFPIHDYFGEVVGFSARTMDATAATAKYINSPETVAYNKSRVLFGFHKAKETIRQLGSAVVVEGQMDCIQAHQAGFTNTIATSGTALTFDQLKAIKRLTDTVLFCFDADNAGIAATKRAGEIALRLGLKLKIIEMPEGKDPDELIKKDPGAWKAAVEQAGWFMDFYIKQGLREHPFGSIEQKQYVSSALVPLLQLLPDPIERVHYEEVISKDYGVATSLLKVVAPDLGRAQDQTVEKVINQLPSNPMLPLEKLIAGGLLTIPEFTVLVKPDLNSEDFTDPDIKQLVSYVVEGFGIPGEYFDLPLAKEVQFMVESQLEYLDNNSTALVNELLKSFHILKLHGIRARQEQLTVALKHAEQQGSTLEVQALGKEFAHLASLRMQYEAKL
jgi:DNA primase